jgi:predicted nuclease with TOPRIM domain
MSDGYAETEGTTVRPYYIKSVDSGKILNHKQALQVLTNVQAQLDDLKDDYKALKAENETLEKKLEVRDTVRDIERMFEIWPEMEEYFHDDWKERALNNLT